MTYWHNRIGHDDFINPSGQLPGVFPTKIKTRSKETFRGRIFGNGKAIRKKKKKITKQEKIKVSLSGDLDTPLHKHKREKREEREEREKRERRESVCGKNMFFLTIRSQKT